MTNLEYARSLRLLADFYEAHPEMPQPFRQIWVHCGSREVFVKAVATLAQGGTVTKSVDPEESSWPHFHAKRSFGGIEVDVQIDRKTVCRLISPAVYDCPDSLLKEAAEYRAEVEDAGI